MSKITKEKKVDVLNNCVGCGDAPNEDTVIDHDALGQMRVECSCGCCGPWGNTFEEADSLWNGMSKERYIKGIRHGIKICEMRDVESLNEGEFQEIYKNIMNKIINYSDKTLLDLADHCNPKKAVEENAKN